jgi:D-alanine-D-alanine ligase
MAKEKKVQKLKVLVLAGGPSSEHEVSLRTAQMILKHLDSRKHDASLVIILKDGRWHFHLTGKIVSMSDALKHIIPDNFDFIFIAMHGIFGEDGRMQALLEWAGIPYAGSGVLSSAMAMDKSISNIFYEAGGLNVAPYAVIDRRSKPDGIKLGFPLVVKPVSGGSSVGISIVKDKKSLGAALKSAFKEDSRVMVQKYVTGREFTCGLLEGADGKPFALPPTEIIPKASAFFDYEAKYATGGSLEITPANLSAAKTKALQKAALRAHMLLGCSGMSRSDFIMKDSKFYILETNTIPGMTETSLLPQAAKAAGLALAEVLELIIASGLREK